MRITSMLSFAAAATVASFVSAAVPTLTAMTTFGNGDGWRAPGEIVAGDLAATNNGITYNFLGSAGTERGIAYNTATKNLYLVTRSTSGTGVRILNGATGVDAGTPLTAPSLPVQAGYTGGTFVLNMIGVADDGAIYAGNLSGATNSAFKVYRWSNEADPAPTIAFNANGSTFSRTRTGDSFDVIGSGTGTAIVASGGGTDSGYALLTTTNGTTYAAAPVIPSVATGKYRLGLTFAGSANKVWGKQTSDNIFRSTVSPLGLDGQSTVSSAGEAPMDYVTIGGVPYLAMVDVNNSNVRVYDATNPAALVQVTIKTNTTGTLVANGNGVGQVKWGDVNNATLSATLYALSATQGIQAFTFAVPEPTTLAAVAGVALIGLRRRR